MVSSHLCSFPVTFCWIYHAPIYSWVLFVACIPHDKYAADIRFNYSLKNIGLPTHNEYWQLLIVKTKCDGKHIFTFTAPPIAELKPFKEDVAKMIENKIQKNQQ